MYYSVVCYILTDVSEELPASVIANMTAEFYGLKKDLIAVMHVMMHSLKHNISNLPTQKICSNETVWSNRIWCAILSLLGVRFWVWIQFIMLNVVELKQLYTHK
jgi:hypothetical protein